MPVIPMTPLRVKLREVREARGLTQEALSELAGVRQAAISAIELGQRQRIDLDILDRLATALDVEPGSLIQREPEKPKRRKSA